MPSSSKNRSHGRRRHSRKLQWERLEDLTLLSTYLYVDYGDNFAGGVLRGEGVTTGNLVNRAAPGGEVINGPGLTNPDNEPYAANTPFAFTSFANFREELGSTAEEIAQFRATINTMVERAFAPYDVVVIDLTVGGTTVAGKPVAAARNLDDVSRTLAASGSRSDSYVFVVQAIIDGTVADPTTDPTQFPVHNYVGLASDLDIGETNKHQGVALTFLNAKYDLNEVALTITHEAGHLLGLAHSWRSDKETVPDPRESLGPYKGQLDLYHSADIMSYVAESGVSVFSRAPTTADMIPGQWTTNLDPDRLNAVPTPYDHFKADPRVGIRSSIEYVTGTGAHDVITIARIGPNRARVTVEPFFDAGRTIPIRVPSQRGASWSYVIDTTKTILVDGGNGNDLFKIDGGLGASITVRGDTFEEDPAGRSDALIVFGKGAARGVYTPGTNLASSPAEGEDLRGEIRIGATVVRFQEFTKTSFVFVPNVQNFVLRTPTPPVGRTSGNDLAISAGEAGRGWIGGAVSGAAVVPLNYVNIASLTIDATAGGGGAMNRVIIVHPAAGRLGGADRITVQGGGSPADVLRLVGEGQPRNGQVHRLGPKPGEGYVAISNNRGPGGAASDIAPLVRYEGIGVINDSIPARRVRFLSATDRAPVGGITRADLAAGVLRPTVGGRPFGEIRFANKERPSTAESAPTRAPARREPTWRIRRDGRLIDSGGVRPSGPRH